MSQLGPALKGVKPVVWQPKGCCGVYSSVVLHATANGQEQEMVAKFTCQQPLFGPGGTHCQVGGATVGLATEASCVQLPVPCWGLKSPFNSTSFE